MTTPIDPVAAVRAALVQSRVIPGRIYHPDPTPEVPDPPPVVEPDRVQILPDVAALPAALLSGDGQGLDLGNAVALLWAVVNSLQIRSVTGRVTLTAKPVATPTWAPGQSADLNVVWDVPAPVVPTGDPLISTEAGALAQGRTSARMKAGTVTATGCTITVTNISAAAVIPADARPITYTVTAQYLWTPTITTS